jgi:hypothetical protein
MSLTKIQTCATYRSESGGQFYTFTVVQSANNCISVKEIIGPYGPIGTSNTCLPESVSEDIQTAIDQLKVASGMLSTSSGFAEFSNESSKVITFDTALSNTNYRVVFSVEENFLIPIVTSKTTTGFTIELNITHTGAIGYDVLV